LSRNVFLIIEYDGKRYEGWQSQKNGNTIQDVITEKIYMLTGEKISLIGQGRTDAGVHALGQTANFHITFDWELAKFHHALNRLLPDDINIKKVEEVSRDFNARFDATGRVYEYRILTGPEKNPFLRDYTWHVPFKLDVATMKKAAGYLKGEHDFSSFRAASCSAKNPIRNLAEIKIEEEDKLLYFTFKANAFLQHMVRNIVGLLVEIGAGKFPPEYAREVLEHKDVTKKSFKCWRKAPAHGLFLKEVIYNS